VKVAVTAKIGRAVSIKVQLRREKDKGAGTQKGMRTWRENGRQGKNDIHQSIGTGNHEKRRQTEKGPQKEGAVKRMGGHKTHQQGAGRLCTTNKNTKSLIWGKEWDKIKGSTLLVFSTKGSRLSRRYVQLEGQGKPDRLLAGRFFIPMGGQTQGHLFVFLQAIFPES